MPFGYGASVVVSGSMEPELSVNDLVIIKSVPEDEINVGDIIVYESDDMLIIHKVISRDANTIITQGTANNTADKPIDISAVKGKLVYSFSNFGSVISAIKSPVGIIMLLALAVILFEAPYFMKKKKDTQDIEKIKEEIRKLKNDEK